MSKKIIVVNLNKLRQLYPNQSFVSNVLRPTSQDEFNEVIEILDDGQITYTIAESKIADYHIS